MPLSRGELNPLSIVNLRKLSFIPEHFTTISIDPWFDKDKIDNWINLNLNSRYALRLTTSIDDSNRITETLVIGLEDPKEITMLTLGCPYLYEKKDLF